MFGRMPDEIERTAMIGQPERMDVVGYRLGRLKRLVGDERHPAFFNGPHERVDQVGFFRVVAGTDRGLVENGGKSINVLQRLKANRVARDERVITH